MTISIRRLLPLALISAISVFAADQSEFFSLKEELPAVRAKAQTPQGQALLKPVLRVLQTGAAPQTSATGDAGAMATRIQAPIDHLDLKDEDTIVFLGDSLTMQCGYTQYIEDFYYTRFPQLKIKFHNAGVGGDCVFHGINRFNEDVAAYKPKYVTVMFGGNDAGQRQWDSELFAKYAADMLILIRKVQEIGATPILMGPGMYDRRALLLKPSPGRPYDSEMAKWSNPVMGYYSAYLRDQAGELGLLYVDVYSALNNYAFEQRVHNSNYMVSIDGWHPIAAGEMIMAAIFLDAVHAPRVVSSTTASFDVGKGWSVTLSPEGMVTEVNGTADHLSFTSLEPALPWIVPADAAYAFKASGAGDRHSAETLQIQGLTPGTYEVKIDGIPIGFFPSSLLSAQLDLQYCDKAPQVQQALVVAMLNQEKNKKAVHEIRMLYREAKINLPNRFTQEIVEASLKALQPRIEPLTRLKDDYEQKIRAAAVPKAHAFEIVRTGSK